MTNALKKPVSHKHQAIIRTATQLFMRDGYDGTSMDRLALTVPVSKPTLYKHFKDKDALFVAVMSHKCQQFLEAVSGHAINIKSASEMKKALMDIALSYVIVLRQPDSVRLYRLILSEVPKFPELASLFYENGPQRGLSFLSDLLKNLHQKKLLQVRDPWMSANIFFAMLREEGHLRHMLGLRVNAKEHDPVLLSRYVVEVFIRGHGV